VFAADDVENKKTDELEKERKEGTRLDSGGKAEIETTHNGSEGRFADTRRAQVLSLLCETRADGMYASRK